MNAENESFSTASGSAALEQTQAVLAEIQALYHVACSLTGFNDLLELLQTVVDSVAKVLSADRVTLITFDMEAHRVINFVKGGSGTNDVVDVAYDELWDGLSGWVLRELKPALSTKFGPDPRESLDVQRRRAETNCGAIIVVPVRYQDKILGTMTAINRPEERDFTQRDVELMLAMASHSAIAIENTHLYNELQSINVDLEQRVTERTAELAKTNARLREEITERERITQALRVSEARYRTLVETMNDGLVMGDKNLHITFTNPRFCELLGYTSAELMGQPTEAFLDAANRVLYQTQISKRWMGEQGAYELDWTTKDGRKISTWISATPLMDDHGEFQGSFAVVTDITERKQAEAALRKSEKHAHEFQEKLRTLQEISLELANLETIEQLCRRAIELGLSSLGYDRLGLLLFDNAEKTRVSRFGIESNGELRAERDVSFKVEEDRMYRQLPNREAVFVSENADLKDFDRIVGHGWNIVVGIWDANDSMGWLAADNFFGKQPLLPYQLELLKLYGLTLGHLVSRKRTEAALREREKQYRLLAENSMDMISLHSPGGTYLYVSPACQTLLGYEPDDLIGHSAYEFFHPADIPAVMESHNAILEQPVVYTVPYRIRRKDGQYIWFETNSRTLRDSKTGAVIEIQAGSRDISERKHAEAALQRYNQRLSILRDIDQSILIADSPDAIAKVVLEHLAQLIPCEWVSIVLYNADITEEKVFAWQNTPDVNIRVEESQPVIQNHVVERLKLGQSVVTGDLKSTEGPRAQLAEDLLDEGMHSAMASPLVAQGRLFGVLALAARAFDFFTLEHQQIAEEIGAQVAIALHQAELDDQIAHHNIQLEARVRERTTQLENANRELELFSYSVSHDLRAPLRAIEGFAEIIARRHRDSLNDEGQRYFDNIVNASEQMNQLITDLLAYARLGRQRVRLQALPLHPILAEVVEGFAPRIEETQAQVYVADDLPDLLGDRTLLKQIFANLLENALTYHRLGIPPRINVTSSLEANDAVICVADNGIGIPEEFREKVFNIFQRLHSQDQYPGTGIGLALVRRSVELLNGTVWVESISKEGSIFCIRLPRPVERDKS